VSQTLWYIHTSRGAITAESLRSTKVWVPATLGRLRPAPGHRSGWGLVRVGVAPSRCRVQGYRPRKIFENSDAKSCILVTSPVHTVFAPMHIKKKDEHSAHILISNMTHLTFYLTFTVEISSNLGRWTDRDIQTNP